MHRLKPWKERALTVALSAVLALSAMPMQGIADEIVPGGGDSKTAEKAPATSAASEGAGTASTDATAGQQTGGATAQDQGQPAKKDADGATQSAGAAAASDGAAAPQAAAPASAPAPTEASPASDPAEEGVVYVNGTSGSDDNDGATAQTAFASLAKAVTVSGVKTIHVTGALSLAKPVTIPQNVALVASGNATFTGNGNDGVVLSSGTKLSCESGATLTMSGFRTALSVGAGAEVNDGTYVLDGNAIGFELKGTGKIAGSSRSACTVSAKNSSGRAFSYENDSRFENCTVDVQANSETSEQYAGLYLTNASLTTRGVWYYFDPAGGKGGIHMDNADFTAYKATGSYSYRQVMSILGSSEIKNGSTLTADGSRVTLSAPLAVTDSKVVIKNSTAGGLNINYKGGDATFTNSTLETTNMKYTPSFGAAQSDGPCSITFLGNSVVNTDAKDKTADNGGANRDNDGTYVVTGGSYLVAYDPTYNHDVTTPTNGEANGNECLSYLTFADSSVSQVNPINKNGQRYAYSVATPSKDGQKHVFVPAAKVTVTLNDGNATFEDGTASDKAFSTVRGYKLGFVTGNDAAKSLGTPTDKNGVKFLGWYYKDASGTEYPFDFENTEFDADTEVYAKWDAKTVVYHNGYDQSYIQTVDTDATAATVASFDDAAAANRDFAVAGKTFKTWTTAADGSGTAYNPGDAVSFDGSTTQVDLYAQYTDNQYRVAFSANGGTFASSSVFKTNPDVFAIEKDATGGEVAVLKQGALYNQKLHDLLGSFDYNNLTPGKAAASKTGSTLDNTTEWNTQADGKGSSLRFDDYKIWIFPVPGENPQITADTTYYLTWKDSVPAADHVSRPYEIQGDMFAGSEGNQKDSASVLRVTADGKSTFALTGAVDVSRIKSQMESIESQFGEDKGDLSKIALTDASSTFTATFTLPEGVVAPKDLSAADVKATGLGDCYKIESASVEGNKITVTFSLKGAFTNYQELKNAVNSTGGAGAKPSPAGRRVLAKYQALGAAAGATAAAGTQMDPLSDAIELTIPGFSLDQDAVTNGKELTVTGDVSGSFGAVASNETGKVKRFNFTWTGTQAAAGKDVRAKDESTIQLTILVKKPYQLELDADMLASVLPEKPTDADLKAAGTNTEHDSIVNVLQGQKLNITGTIDAKSVKNQMNEIESQFGVDQDRYASIAISDLASSFTATFTLPKGMSFPAGLSKDTLAAEGLANTFAVTDAQVSGNTLVVTLGLNKNSITNYQQLKDAVDAMGDTLKVTVPAVVVDADVADGTTLSAMGTLTGKFDAVATSAAGTEKDFSFVWTGKQTRGGADALSSSSDDAPIQLSVQTPGIQKASNTLDGDIWGTSIESSTQALMVGTDETFSLTGAIDTTGIRAQMEGIEAQFGEDKDDLSKISLLDTSSSFTACVTFPDQVTLPTNMDQVTVGGLGDLYTVTDKHVEGQNLYISFGLKGDYQNYQQLRDAVFATGVPGVGAGTWITLTVGDLSLKADEVTNNQQLTVTGNVKGSFDSVARGSSGRTEHFQFDWTAKQVKEGKDAFATSDDALQQTLLTDKPEQRELAGDMWTTDEDRIADSSNTQNVVNRNSGEDFVQTISVSAQPFKDSVLDFINEYYRDADLSMVMLDSTSLGAPLTMTFDIQLPEGLELNDFQPSELENDDYVLGGGSKFASTLTKKDNRTATITASLKPGSVKTLQDLKGIVDSLGDANNNMLSVHVHCHAAESNGQDSSARSLTTRAAVASTMRGRFVDASQPSSPARALNVTLVAFQDPATQDAAATDQDKAARTITNTVLVPGKQGPSPEDGDNGSGGQPGETPRTPTPGDVKDDAPKTPAAPAAAPKASATTPNTGDSTNYAPLSMLGALGLGAVVVAAVVRRRWRDER